MKKIIHLSDLHVGDSDLGNQLRFLVDYLVFVKEPASNYVVIVTGDLVEHASDDTYGEAAEGLGRLKDAGFDVLCAPGNHDYGSGSFGHKKYVEPFKQLFRKGLGREDEEDSKTYPTVDIIGGVAFIGLDSMAAELHWYDSLWANGELGPRQRGRLEDLLSTDSDVAPCTFKVVYLHHHPMHPRPFHELKDAKKLEKILKGNVQVLLFGHNHDGHNFNGRWGIPRIYDGGTSTRKEGKTAAIRVIDLDREPRKDYILDLPS